MKSKEYILKMALAEVLASFMVHNWIVTGNKQEWERIICINILAPQLARLSTIKDLENQISNMTVY